MRRPRLLAAVTAQVAVVSLVAAPIGASAIEAPTPFVTSERPFLVPIAEGVVIQPILTTGDVIGEGEGAYQMSGTPDGIGWYGSSPNGTVEVYFNHELHPDFDPSGSRVSHLTLNRFGEVTAAEYVVMGDEGYEWFCSSTLEIIDGSPWYFTGEESKHSPRKGMSIALDVATGEYHETPWFGHFGHENVVPVQGIAKAHLQLAEDGFSEFSQLFAYQADTFAGAIDGTEGGLRVWVPNQRLDGNPSADDLPKGDTLRGSFERVPNAADLTPLQLEKYVQSIGAFDMNRIEDIVADPNHPGRVYVAETGRANQETVFGRVYMLDVDADEPRKATLSVILDASAGDDIFSPDNLGISDAALVIQEDRNWKKSGSNRVLVYDLATGTLTAAARTDPDPEIVEAEGLGAWESSGVVSVADAFGQGWWLVNVQAHDTAMSVPDQSLEPDSAEGEGGQLTLVFIPGT